MGRTQLIVALLSSSTELTFRNRNGHGDSICDYRPAVRDDFCFHDWRLWNWICLYRLYERDFIESGDADFDYADYYTAVY